jgi:hypothetical protein
VSEDEGTDDVGSVGEEAAKLFGALAGALREGLAEVDAHVATDDPECRWCPVCRAVHLVRETSPEVKAHLASAAASLVQAAAGFLATHVPDHASDHASGHASDHASGERRDGAAGVERIDLDEDVSDDGWAEDE